MIYGQCAGVMVVGRYCRSMSIPGTVYKAHATGNDFVIYEDDEGRYAPTVSEVRLLCDRHRGIGADGLLRLTHPGHVADVSDRVRADCAAAGAEWFMDYRNADGSLAEMCGNGTRAIALFARRGGLMGSSVGSSLALGTRAGVKTLTYLGDVSPYGHDVFRVDMGPWRMGETEGYAVGIPGVDGSARGTFVDMGNPHVVAVVEDGHADLPAVEDLDLVHKPVVEPRIDSDQNVEFVRVDAVPSSSPDHGERSGPGRATMRVNERGCGETLSCGTGLCATGVVLRSRTGVGSWDITVRGGTLRVDVRDDAVSLTGSATMVAKVELF